MNEIKEYTEKIFEDIKHIDENVNYLSNRIETKKNISNRIKAIYNKNGGKKK